MKLILLILIIGVAISDKKRFKEVRIVVKPGGYKDLNPEIKTFIEDKSNGFKPITVAEKEG